MWQSTPSLFPGVCCQFSNYRPFNTDSPDSTSLLDILLTALPLWWQHFAFTLALLYPWICTPHVHSSTHSFLHVWTHQAIIQKLVLSGAIVMLSNISHRVPLKCMCVCSWDKTAQELIFCPVRAVTKKCSSSTSSTRLCVPEHHLPELPGTRLFDAVLSSV